MKAFLPHNAIYGAKVSEAVKKRKELMRSEKKPKSQTPKKQAPVPRPASKPCTNSRDATTIKLLGAPAAQAAPHSMKVN